MIHINDPVAGTAFMLNPKDRTASKMMVKINMDLRKPGFGSGASGGVGVGVGVGVGASSSGDTVTVHVPPMPPPPPGVGIGMARMSAETLKGQVNKESLGTQTIEGVQAEGTRTTLTIPAGQIGNEQPIQVINERWYSPELRVVVMTRHSDPRTGEEVYKLTNINRSEPSHQLFEVPSDYTVKEGGDFMRTFNVHTSGDKRHNEQ